MHRCRKMFCIVGADVRVCVEGESRGIPGKIVEILVFFVPFETLLNVISGLLDKDARKQKLWFLICTLQ